MQGIDFTVRVDSEDPDDELVDELTRQLLREVRDCDIESADLIAIESAPPGAKSAGGFELGALAVSVLPNAVKQLVEFLFSWVKRGSDRVVKVSTQIGDRRFDVEYNPKTMSNDDLKRLVEDITGTLARVK